MSAEAHKAAGNKLFSQQLYEDAVKEYSTAIVHIPLTWAGLHEFPQCQNPTVATYYTNRALCHLKLKRFDDVVADCNRAVDIDERAVKGYYLKGQALTEKKRYAEALTDLKKGAQ
ncbi:hypothetical protein BC936DRAFT_144952 [Jimgerdemannia flammicorona]|uniref:RING-type E3 ubiquitin transferase n=1 Tax=Jimgerdemannia flammicorona TaxID=994334 RepID=A0A433DB97_9FUNG|nr:hypothetical protein BC936DRAFT_144952 [Jimgerdemannia flammicorona]